MIFFFHVRKRNNMVLEVVNMKPKLKIHVFSLRHLVIFHHFLHAYREMLSFLRHQNFGLDVGYFHVMSCHFPRTEPPTLIICLAYGKIS
jgi:hypothetical protein